MKKVTLLTSEIKGNYTIKNWLTDFAITMTLTIMALGIFLAAFDALTGWNLDEIIGELIV